MYVENLLVVMGMKEMKRIANIRMELCAGLIALWAASRSHWLLFLMLSSRARQSVSLRRFLWCFLGLTCQPQHY